MKENLIVYFLLCFISGDCVNNSPNPLLKEMERCFFLIQLSLKISVNLVNSRNPLYLKGYRRRKEIVTFRTKV